MQVVCWSCSRWYDNAVFSWSCPHERLFPGLPGQAPHEISLHELTEMRDDDDAD